MLKSIFLTSILIFTAGAYLINFYFLFRNKASWKTFSPTCGYSASKRVADVRRVKATAKHHLYDLSLSHVLTSSQKLCRPNKTDEIYQQTNKGVVYFKKRANASLKEILAANQDIQPGGYWHPQRCKSQSRVAIIIPYRDRLHHLHTLLRYLIPLLKWQKLEFRIYVSEQQGTELFNKGRLYNAAFFVAQHEDIECVIFHDVDLVPQLLTTPYNCPELPTHLSPYVDSLQYKKAYEYLAGGVFAIRVEQFRKVNGYSQQYWSWGGEDDDMGLRVLRKDMPILRPNIFDSQYRMLPHSKRHSSSEHIVRKLLQKSRERIQWDGLSSGCDGYWRILSVNKEPLYTRILIDVGLPPPQWLEPSTTNISIET